MSAGMFDVTADARRQAADYLSQAEDDAAIVPGLNAAIAPRRIDHAAVIGTGTMGGGIALALAAADVRVTAIDSDRETLARGLARMRNTLETSVVKGRLDANVATRRLSCIRGTTDMQEAADADIWIEAVFEDMALKQRLFRDIDAIAKPGAVLATNTSGLDIEEIAAVTSRPQDVIGAHFFSPAHVMRLLEVVRTTRTVDDVIATAMHLGHRLGKVAVLARVYPGFIGNALFRQYNREAHFLVEDGALPHEVDEALVGFGFAMGIFAVHDMAGNDVGYQTRKAQIATRAQDRRWNDLILKLAEMGRLGQKTGRGWYRYEAGSRTPLRDPGLEAFIVAESARMGIQRRPIGRDEILERCLFGMINEGANLLEFGIAQRASDIDLAMVTGYGFPTSQGGPMHMADRIGLRHVLAVVQRLHREHGAWWEPAPLLARLAHEGCSFAEWNPSA